MAKGDVPNEGCSVPRAHLRCLACWVPSIPLLRSKEFAKSNPLLVQDLVQVSTYRLSLQTFWNIQQRCRPLRVVLLPKSLALVEQLLAACTGTLARLACSAWWPAWPPPPHCENCEREIAWPLTMTVTCNWIKTNSCIRLTFCTRVVHAADTADESLLWICHDGSHECWPEKFIQILRWVTA